jgi:ketosteroid isomerase-like protein
MTQENENHRAVRAVLESWAKATRENRKDDILKNHAPELVIFDALPPLRYDSAASYRASWGDWQPDSQGAVQFDLENVVVHTSDELSTAHCLIRCGGTLPDGRSFQDLVRATFCLRKRAGSWEVFHQHISKPFQRSAN